MISASAGVITVIAVTTASMARRTQNWMRRIELPGRGSRAGSSGSNHVGPRGRNIAGSSGGSDIGPSGAMGLVNSSSQFWFRHAHDTIRAEVIISHSYTFNTLISPGICGLVV